VLDDSPRLFFTRLVLGIAGALGAGWLVFRALVFDPTHPAFQCVTVGILCSAVLASVRVGSHGLVLVFVVVFGLSRYGLTDTGGWLFGLSGFLLGAGIYLVALIYDLLGRRGLVLGKFLLVGPLLGGLFLALTPMVEFRTLTSDAATRTLMVQVLIGLLIGDGAGFGVEMAELPRAIAARAEATGGQRAG
jgi:hypothetical protein